MSPIKLYSALTTNGYKVVTFLELLKVDYELHILDLSKGEQLQDWFLKLNPLGQIPVLTTSNNQTIFESGAVLLYIADVYDLENKYSFAVGSELYWEQIQWLFVQTTGLGQANGNAKASLIRGDLKSQQFYLEKVLKFYEALEAKIGGIGGFIVGDKLSVVDISFWGLIKNRKTVGLEIDLASKYPNLADWFGRLEAIPEFELGFTKR